MTMWLLGAEITKVYGSLCCYVHIASRLYVLNYTAEHADPNRRIRLVL